jgi:hypothetical protein
VLCLLPGPLGAVHDAGTTQIVFPTGEIPYRSWMLPLNVVAQAVVKNFGDSAASFQVQLRIDTALVETSQVTDLPPQESVLVQFPVLLPDSGMHSITCSTALAGDVQPANDRIVESFETYLTYLNVGFLNPGHRAQVGDAIIPMGVQGTHYLTPLSFGVSCSFLSTSAGVFRSRFIPPTPFDSLRRRNPSLQLLPAKSALRGPPSQPEPFRPGETASFSLGFGFRAYLVQPIKPVKTFNLHIG